VRERFFTPRLRVKSLEELNVWLLDKCVAYAKAHSHPEQTAQTIWQMFEAERGCLVRYAGPFDGFHCVPASVSKTLPNDLLHRPALNMEGSTNTRNRIHSLQLPLHPSAKDGWSDETGGGSKLDAGHPARGVNIPRRNTDSLSSAEVASSKTRIGASFITTALR